MVYTDGTALVADTLEELHPFAAKCGVFLFYDHRRRPHYMVEKTSLPTIMAHGAKRIKTAALVKLSNAMAKKRELWYLNATDEEIREKIKVYAPWKPKEMVFYEGQEFTQQEMFEIWFNMFKDLQAGKNVSSYKLPKVLPLHPRKDPPTDREILADLYGKIEHGKQLLKEEEAKPEADPNATGTQDGSKIRNPERIEEIKTKMAELQAEYDPLQLQVQKDAIAELSAKIDAAQIAADAYEIKTDEDARQALIMLANLKAALTPLQERMAEIEAEHAKRKQEEPAGTIGDAIWEKDVKTVEEMQKEGVSFEEDPDYLKDNPNLTDAPDMSKYPTSGGGTLYKQISPLEDPEEGDEIQASDAVNDKEAENKALNDFIAFGETHEWKGDEEDPKYKVVYDPANDSQIGVQKEGESYSDVNVEKSWPSEEAMKNLNDPHFGEKERREQDNNFNLMSANDAKTPIQTPTDDTLPPPTPPEMLKDINPLPPQPE